DPLDLRVQAGERDPGVQQDQAGVHVLDLLLHHPQGPGHVPREPLDVVLIGKLKVFVFFLVFHLTTPASSRGKKQNSTLPRMSSSAMQPIEEDRLSSEALRLSPIRNSSPSGTV